MRTHNYRISQIRHVVVEVWAARVAPAPAMLQLANVLVGRAWTFHEASEILDARPRQVIDMQPPQERVDGPS